MRVNFRNIFYPSILCNIDYYLFVPNSQEISALTKQFPAQMLHEKQTIEGYTKNQMTPGSNWGPGYTSESAQMSSSIQTGSNSPISVFKPIVTSLPNPSEERTLSPPQCRLDYPLKCFHYLLRVRFVVICSFYFYCFFLYWCSWSFLDTFLPHFLHD